MTTWPLHENGSIERAPAPSASDGVQIGPSGVANTKTGWTQLIASTTYESSVVMLRFRASSHTEDMLVDIGIGAAASEQVVLSNIYVSGSSIGISSYMWIPLWIPSGKRISARMQGSTTLVNVNIGIYFASASMFGEFGFQRGDAIGATTADSGGTAIDAGGTANTKGSYAQLTASTSNAYRALYVLAGNNANAARSANAAFAVDIAIGAAASERIIIPDLYIRSTSQEQIFPSILGPFFINVPSGVRLSARCSSDSNVAGDRVIDVTLLGLL